jgi:dTDP-glucose 4,6-dehydratase
LNNVLLVTGGAGFIGSEFVRQESRNEFWERIYVIDALTYASDLKRIELEIDSGRVDFINTRVERSENYKSVFSEVSHVTHFAAETHVDRSIQDGYPFLRSNIEGTFAILEATREIPRIRTLVVSTDEVYGSISTGEATEESKINSASIYSASKASADLLAIANYLTHQQDIVITRCCNNYGPHQTAEKLIPLAITRLLAGLKVPIYGTGENIREWIYVSDHTRAIKKVLIQGKSGEIYNIGSGIRKSNIELIEVILQMLGLDYTSVEYVSDRKGHDFRYALASQKISSELNWTPEIELDEGLKMTIDFYRNLGGV